MCVVLASPIETNLMAASAKNKWKQPHAFRVSNNVKDSTGIQETKAFKEVGRRASRSVEFPMKRNIMSEK
jgi:hypothetical protein